MFPFRVEGLGRSVISLVEIAGRAARGIVGWVWRIEDLEGVVGLGFAPRYVEVELVF